MFSSSVPAPASGQSIYDEASSESSALRSSPCEWKERPYLMQYRQIAPISHATEWSGVLPWILRPRGSPDWSESRVNNILVPHRPLHYKNCSAQDRDTHRRSPDSTYYIWHIPESVLLHHRIVFDSSIPAQGNRDHALTPASLRPLF